MAQSPLKLIEEGKYDEAIDASIKRIQKGRGDITANYFHLKHAYESSCRIDEGRITELRATGAPDIWYDVFILYAGMQDRNNRISVIRERIEADQVNLQLADYSEDLEAARNNAEAYLYAHAQALLETGEQEDALQAYIELLKVARMSPDYKDVEKLMRQALGAGAGRALLETRNKSDMPLSPDYLSGMTDFELKPQERIFLDYARKEIPGEKYTLLIRIVIDQAEITPGTVSEKEYTASMKDPESADQNYKDEEKKEADKNHPDYNKCKIKEIYEVKSAVMKGSVQYIDGNTGSLLYVVPVKALSLFENHTATASGDMYACPPEVYDLLDKPKKKFPSNADMLVEVGKEFKKLVRDVIWDGSFIK